MDKLKIEYLHPDALKPYAGNAKKHPAEQIEQIKKSIEEFGFNDPVAIWNGEVVEGHGRLIAAIEMGINEIPVFRLDSLTDEQRRAYMLVHNKLTMNTDFDFDLLQAELDDINDIDMSDFGFADVEIEEDEKPEKEIIETISVVIECDGEEQAQELYDRLTGEGYRCKVSTL